MNIRIANAWALAALLQLAAGHCLAQGVQALPALPLPAPSAVLPAPPAMPVAPFASLLQPAPAAPSAPAPPSSPPAGPRWPHGPQGPVGPVGPLGPPAPHAPHGQPAPQGPQAPQAPQTPQIPHGPTAPHAPAAPAAPSSPLAPQLPLVPGQRSYAPGSFDGIEIAGSAVVRFVQGSSEQVVVDGDDEVQRSVRLELHGGTLSIRPGGSWKFWNAQRPQIAITARDLKRLSISGAADFVAPGAVTLGDLAVHISGAGLARFDQFKADALRFSVSGSGDGQFAGSARELTLGISGRGDFRGEELQTQRCRVLISGVGSARVWVQNDLAVTVSGVGKVDYWGTPEVSRRTSGMATINGRGPRVPPP